MLDNEGGEGRPTMPCTSSYAKESGYPMKRTASHHSGDYGWAMKQALRPAPCGLRWRWCHGPGCEATEWLRPARESDEGRCAQPVWFIVLLVQMQELPPGYNDSAIDKILKAAQSALSAFSLVALPCESILIVYPTRLGSNSLGSRRWCRDGQWRRAAPMTSG